MLRAIYAVAPDLHHPLSGLRVGERPAPSVPEGWTTVNVRAASLNHHDLFTLRGIGINPDRFPMILGVDAAGTDPDGKPVVVHGLITDPDRSNDDIAHPARTVISEVYQGTLAEQVTVPRGNLVPLPAEMSFEEGSCVYAAYAAAYHMLFTRGRARPGQTVLVQGASGGLSTALISLSRIAGLRVWATGRTDAKRRYARETGAHQAFAVGAALPEPADLVVDSVGTATWGHSLRWARRGGTVVISGATSGSNPPARLSRICYEELTVVGALGATRAEFASVIDLMLLTGLRPRIGSVLPFSAATTAFASLADGTVCGKVVMIPD